MKIIVFENGEPGRRAEIPGENVRGELEELLGGELEWRQVSRRLALVWRKDGADKPPIPMRYTRQRPGNVPELIFGDGALVHVTREGRAGDITADDLFSVRPWLAVAPAD